MPHDDTTTTQNNPAGSGNLLILLCAPSHDDLTEYTSKLLENFQSLGEPTVFCKIESPLTYDQLLSNLAVDPKTTEIGLIFCGHGETASLQGPGAPPGTPDYKKLRSFFYDDSFLHLGPTFMLAFCCSAAVELGDAYYRLTTGSTFVGFDDEIGFVKKGGDYADWWRKILHTSASAMLSANDIQELEKPIREIYQEALAHFDPRTGRRYRWGLMMRAYLRKQLKDISFIRT
ncbi:MAG TPA: hypothetical protein VGC66_13735 [Pyrinomonadaceae bacterium]|jgi:hypothetical protein